MAFAYIFFSAFATLFSLILTFVCSSTIINPCMRFAYALCFILRVLGPSWLVPDMGQPVCFLGCALLSFRHGVYWRQDYGIRLLRGGSIAAAYPEFSDCEPNMRWQAAGATYFVHL